MYLWGVLCTARTQILFFPHGWKGEDHLGKTNQSNVTIKTVIKMHCCDALNPTYFHSSLNHLVHATVYIFYGKDTTVQKPTKTCSWSTSRPIPSPISTTTPLMYHHRQVETHQKGEDSDLIQQVYAPMSIHMQCMLHSLFLMHGGGGGNAYSHYFTKCIGACALMGLWTIGCSLLLSSPQACYCDCISAYCDCISALLL